MKTISMFLSAIVLCSCSSTLTTVSGKAVVTNITKTKNGYRINTRPVEKPKPVTADQFRVGDSIPVLANVRY